MEIVKSRVGIVAAWLAGTLISTAVAYAAVSTVRTSVVDEPSAPTIQSTTVAVAAVTSTAPRSAAGTADDPLTPDPTTAATTAPEETPSTAGVSVDPSASSSTTTTPTTQTTETTNPTTTTPPVVGEVRTFDLVGGTVSIEVFADRLVLLGATPDSGWSVDDREVSARHIEIEFRSDGNETHFAVELKDDGELDVHIDD